MSVTIVRNLQEDAWRAFVESHPSGNIFHTPEMFQVFSRARMYHPELWAAQRSDNRLSALFLPVRVRVWGRPFGLFTERAIVYGSLLCAPGAEAREAADELLQAYNREAGRTPVFTELRNLSESGDLQRIFGRRGYVFEDHLNYLVDLGRPSEQIFRGFGSRTRKCIRRGMKKGHVQVVNVDGPEGLKALYRILKKTYRRARIPLADRSLFEAVLQILHSKGMARLTLAEVDGRAAACSVELLYKKTIYGWYGGMDRAYSPYGANEILHWDILRWGAENGCRLYDFGGAGKPGEAYGVRDFKAKFGGTLVNYGRNIRVHSSALMGLSKAAYGLLKKLKAFLP